jgi:predicted phage terminase large subunit-like protein
MGGSRIVADGTPKISRPAAALIRRLIKQDKGTVVTRLRTVDNLDNLSQNFYESVVARSKGTRLEQQELEGLLLDDIEGALWTRELLSAIQVGELPTSGGSPDPGRLTKAFVGVDPSDGTETSDEQAYTVIGQGYDRKLYVVESFGERLAPVPFLKKACQAALRWDAGIVLEKNHGGAYLVETLRQVMKDMKITIPFRVVTASQGKRTRAEPVSAFYERGIVRHVHWQTRDNEGNLTWDESLNELEDQMATFTGAVDERSPDRLDSLVWAIHPFLPQSFETSAIPGGFRRYGILNALDEAEERMRGYAQRRMGNRIRPEPGQVPAADGIPDDQLLERMGVQLSEGRRPNVRSYQ